LAAVEKSRAKAPYDLILLDLDMPIMDGIEACQIIRSDRSGNDIKGLLQIDKHDLIMLPEEEQKEDEGNNLEADRDTI
jgi:CheY-like chemotaxis protein